MLDSPPELDQTIQLTLESAINLNQVTIDSDGTVYYQNQEKGPEFIALLPPNLRQEVRINTIEADTKERGRNFIIDP